MNKKLIIGVSAAAVVAVAIGATVALMTSSTPEKIDLSSTHTTAAPTEAPETQPETLPETEPETTSAASQEDVVGITADTDTYSSGNVSIQFPVVSGIADENLAETINQKLKANALSAIAGLGVNEATDSFTVECEIVSVNSRRLTATYTGLWTPEGASYPTNLFYSNTMDLRSGDDLGLSDFTDSYTMAGYVLSPDVTFSGLTEEQTAAALEYRQTVSIEQFTELFSQADFPIQEGLSWPPSFSYEEQGSIFFTFPVPHALGDYVIVRFDPSTK